jgi:hypothetical protein
MMKTSSFVLVSSYSKTSKNDENFEKWRVWTRYGSINKTSKNDENFEKWAPLGPPCIFKNFKK